MIAYWEIARIHYHLHYLTYARKYCEITLNIAERINDKKIFGSARAMMDALNTGWIRFIFTYMNLIRLIKIIMKKIKP